MCLMNCGKTGSFKGFEIFELLKKGKSGNLLR